MFKFSKLDFTNYTWYDKNHIITELRDDMPISGKDLRKLFYDAGYELVPGGGKGSHWKLRRKGCPMVIIPNHKTLKPGTENALRKILKGIVGKIR